MYVTQKGKELYVPTGAKPGDRVWTPTSYDENLEFDLDYVGGPADAIGA